ncbi:MAG: Ig-like domain repeat protein [Clostridiales Family XIII bacterium]|nr:Ig-like domain repeat protein [Clostridiales Family XIII bacterium]
MDNNPAEAPVFTQQPADSTYAKAATARFYVRAASPDSGYLTYQWYRSAAYDAEAYAALTGGGALTEEQIDSIKTGGEPYNSGAPGNMDADGTQSVLTCETPSEDGVNYYFYWVTVTNNKDIDGDGNTTNPGERMSADSELAAAKVVDRTLPDHITNGDFSTVYAPNDQSTIYWSNGGGNVKGAYSIVAQSRLPNWKTTDYNAGSANVANFGDTRQSFQVFNVDGKPFGYYTADDNGAVAEPSDPTKVTANPSSATVDPAFSGKSTNGHGDNGGNTGNFGAIELANSYPSSVYQEVATVPGKVYEWSIDHIRRATSGANDMMAVVMGSAINEQSDLGIDSDLAKTYPASAANGSSELHYPYGINSSTYFYNIVTALATRLDTTLANLTSYGGQSFTQEYNGHTYYIYIASTASSWKTYTGSYTVPAGQGTTVFGFVGIAPAATATGNVLDNITFKSGTDVGAAADTDYTGETKLSAPTRTGFAYGLAEVRGSSVNDLMGIAAYYDPDGAGPVVEQPITPTGSLGTGGWYTGAGDTAFSGAGNSDDPSAPTITFRNLTPGKTYRLVGIPVGAISTGLGTNLNPGAVLDEGYYRDSRINAASSGGTGALPSYDLEIYAPAAGARLVRATLNNTFPDAEYALLAENGSDGVPDVSGPALPGAGGEGQGGGAGTAWTKGEAGSVVFEGLSLNKTYYLVARPLGYTEIGYPQAAYVEGANAWVEIKTPAAVAQDVTADLVSRLSGGRSVRVSGIDDSRFNYSYAIADAYTGEIVGGPIDAGEVTGTAITFNGLSATATYQVVTKLTSGNAWLHGVRVYPFPQSLTADYAGDAVVPEGSSVAGDGGYIPDDVEYIIRPTGRNEVYLVGEPPTSTRGALYRRGTGVSPIGLADQTVVPASVVTGGALGTLSLFDALRAIDPSAGTSFTIAYRYVADVNSYNGAYVLPEYTLTVPGRPPSPTGADYAIDYAGERIEASSALEVRGAGVSWTGLTAGNDASFEDLGWTGAAAQSVRLRKPYTNSTFTSSVLSVTIPERRPAPTELTAALANTSALEEGIVISGFDGGKDYEYKRNNQTAWAEVPHASGSSITLPYDLIGGDYEVRYRATTDAPASFYATVSSPLNIASVNFGSHPYGETLKDQPVPIRNIVEDDVTLGGTSDSEWGDAAIRLTGTGKDAFSLNTTGAKIIPGNNTSVEYTITPNEYLNAGTYFAEVEARYKYSYTGDSENVARANVYLTVSKADWPMEDVTGSLGDVKSDSFKMTVAGAPEDAKLSYSLGGGAWATDPAGQTSHTFTGLLPQHAYTVYVRAEGDDNHNESESRVIATAYTLQATPDASAVISIDYVNEQMRFNQGYPVADYTVRANSESGATLQNGASLTGYANTGSFSLYVVRNASGAYGQSAASSLSVPGRAAAPPVADSIENQTPGSIWAKNATTGKTMDGKINLEGNFQYRVSGSGSGASGWTMAADSATVTAGLYEVRRPPSAAAFASASASVRVLSDQNSVTLHTQTYGTPGTPMKDRAYPSFIVFSGSGSSGWSVFSDDGEEGQRQKDKTTASLLLPGRDNVTSRSHVFKGWYEYNETEEDFTGSAVAEAPAENPAINHNYYAKWVVRPTVQSVATSYGGVETNAVIELDSATASQGLSIDAPVKLSVRLTPGDNKLSLDDITLAGAAEGAKLYENAKHTTEVTGDKTVIWGADPTPLYLHTTSVDDSATNVDYELDVYTVRYVGFTSEQTGGVDGVKTSTGIDIGITNQGGGDPVNVTGLVASGITLTNKDGAAVKGALSGSGSKYSLAVTDVTQGDVGVAIAPWAGFTMSPSSVNVTLFRDSTLPTGSIDIRDNSFKEFVNWATFGLFFRNTVDVTITPSDENGDGVDTTEYLLSPESYGSPDKLLEAVKSGAVSWTAGSAGEGKTKFSIQPGQKSAVYAKITDKAGNCAVINSDGVVVYMDSGAEGDTSNLTFVKMSGADKTANVTYNGNSIFKITNDMATPGNEPKLLTQDDDYAALGEMMADGTITFRASYLDTLDASAEGAPYMLNIHYNPLGEVYAGGGGNDPPAVGEITLNVEKADASVALSATPNPVYGDNNVTLSASVATDSVASPLPATGEVTWYKDSGTEHPLGTSSLEDGKASLTVKMDAGTYDGIHADYSGDGNYTAGTATLPAYTVAKVKQEVVSIMDGDSPKTGMTKTHGDLPFTLSASGGSSTGAWSWTSSDETVATVSTSGDADDDVTVTVRKAGVTDITLNRAGDNNHEAATPAALRLTVDEESTPPSPGGERKLTVAAIQPTSLDISWAEASDNLSATENIVYHVYRAESATNVLATPADCASNGTLLASGANMASYSVTGLSSGTSYWLNVVAEDEAGNRAAYAAARVITPRVVSIANAVQVGGVDGKAPTTGIKITFSEPVTGFATDAVEFGAGVETPGAVMPDSASGGRVYTIPISVTGENRSATSVTINGFTDPANGQRYIVSPSTKEGITLYRPVPYPTPTAIIDYVGENIAGLKEGSVYKFSVDGGATYGSGRTISQGGIYPMPYSEFGITLGIKQSGTDIPNEPYVDSPAQILTIPPRPDKPEIVINQPTSASGATSRGSIEIKDPIADRIYEYREMSAEAWTPIDGNTQDGLSGGRYYVRVQAVATLGEVDGKFASSLTPFYIHAYDEVRFDAEIEGYTPQPGKKEVTLDSGDTVVTGVTWSAINPGDSNAFDLTKESGGGGDTWYLQPKEGLKRKTNTDSQIVSYEANIDISHVGDDEPVTEKVIFTVYPSAEFASQNAVEASSTRTDGLTDTLTLRFEYPIELTDNAVFIGDTTDKKQGTSIEKVNDYTYKVNVTPRPSARTGDDIVARIRLDDLGPDYDLQRAKQEVDSITNNEATANVPRAIKDAHVVPAYDGWDSATLQFTLNDDLYGIVAGDLEWAPSEGSLTYPATGAIKLSGDADVTITGVSRVDRGKYDPVTGVCYTYRVFFDVAEDGGGSIKLSIPDYGIDELDVTGEVVKGDIAASGFAYFLDEKGNNYLTDLDAYQVLPGVDAKGAYAAPAVSLRTNVSETGDEMELYRIYLDEEVMDPSLYDATTVSNDTHFFLDGKDQGVIANQIVITLQGDWTRKTGDRNICAVFKGEKDDTPYYFATMGRVNVTNITPTYTLTIEDSEGNSSATARSPYGIPANVDTEKGAFESGRKVSLTAIPSSGYKFDRWEQTAGPVLDLPEGPTGSITMAAVAATVKAIYTDGTPPVTTINPVGGAWTTDGAVTLTATDEDPTTSPSPGTIKRITYRIDGDKVYTAENTSKAEFTLEGEGSHTVEYRAVDAKDNYEATKSAIIRMDSTPPTGKLTVKGGAGTAEGSYEVFTAAPPYALFYKGDGDVNVNASGTDSGSGVSKVEYLRLTASGALSPLEPFANAATADAADGWATASSTPTLTVSADSKNIVYARVTDVAGNSAIINTAGFVRYTDAAADTASISAYRKDATKDVTAKVTLNNNGVAQIVNDMGTPGDATDDVTLTQGTAYEVNHDNGDITFKGTYLSSLAAKGALGGDTVTGGYTLKLTYAPQGAAYGSAAAGNAPASTEIGLAVLRAQPDVSLAIDPAAELGAESETTYNPAGDATLTATVTNISFTGGTAATGAVRFYDNLKDAYLSSGAGNDAAVDSSADSPSESDFIGEATLNAGGVATLSDAVLAAGDREAGDLYAVYAGNDDYLGGADELGEEYSVAKAAQAAPAITGVGVAKQGGDYGIAKIYGEPDFIVAASDASADGNDATGEYSWSGLDTSKADVTSANGGYGVYGKITILSATPEGQPARVAVRRLADRNYDPSPASTLNVDVARRQVMIASIDVADKVYDGTADAHYDVASAVFAGIGSVAESGPILDDVREGTLRLSRDFGTAVYTTGEHPEYAGEDKTVIFSEFRLATDSPSMASSYELVGVPAPTTSSITQATPSWESGDAALSGSDISYGHRLTDSALSGNGVKGVGSATLSGTVSWNVEGAAGVIPGRDDESAEDSGLNPDGYTYPVRFSPSGADAINYRPITGNAKVNVVPATATADAVSGSTILPGELLKESVIFGTVTYALGDNPAAVAEGSWAWDERYVSASAVTGGELVELPLPKNFTTVAAFTPHDKRIAPLQALATVKITTPSTKITTLPSITPMEYGSSLGAIGNADAIGSDGRVFWAWDGGSEEITDYGKFSWQDATAMIRSMSGTQTETLVFTPDDAGKNTESKPATIEVLPVLPTAAAIGTAPAVTLGGLLFDSDIEGGSGGVPVNGGYRFSGAFGGESVPGSLAWVSPSAVLGEGDADDFGNDPVEGVYLAEATFTPAYGYRLAYKPVNLRIPVRVLAAPEKVEELAEEIVTASAICDKVTAAAAAENYLPSAIDRLAAAIAAAEAGVAAGVSQSEADRLEAEIAAALADLKHNHPVMSNSAVGGVSAKGVSVEARVKGVYSDVTGVTFGGTPLQISPAPSDAVVSVLYMGGVAIGTLRFGSAIVTLYSEFVDALPNGAYAINISFADDYAAGSGTVSFVVDRPDPEPEPGPDLAPIKISSLTMSGAPASFSYKASGKGNTLRLNVVVAPADATDKKLSWSSNNTAVATVDESGIAPFTGPEGVVKFTAAATDGSGIYAETTIKAVKNVTGIRTPLAKVYIQRGKRMSLPIVLDDDTAPTATIASRLTWKSSKPLILSVAGGKLKAKNTVRKKTRVHVTAVAANGRKLTVVVTILPKAVKLTKATAKLPKKMKAGATYQIKVKLKRMMSTGVKVSFGSSNKSVIKVDKAGRIFALKKGKATVTVKAGGKRIRKSITVT